MSAFSVMPLRVPSGASSAAEASRPESRKCRSLKCEAFDFRQAGAQSQRTIEEVQLKSGC